MHKRLFQVNRLPLVSSSPAIFQQMTEGQVVGIPNVPVYLNDIMLTGRSDREHLETFSEVLRWLWEAGLWLKHNKCVLEQEAEFLGHKVDASGIHPIPYKVLAIEKAPAPANVSEQRAYLGLLNYYNWFLPNFSNLPFPLHKLLKKDSKLEWIERERESI